MGKKIKWVKDNGNEDQVCRASAIMDNDVYLEFCITKGDFGFSLKRCDGFVNSYIGTFNFLREAQVIAELIMILNVSI